MTVFLCVDDNMGVSFNNRRQSRDSAVVEKIITFLNGNKLYIEAYSAPLFAEYVESTQICEATSDLIGKKYAFIEKNDFSKFNEKISKIILFKWNRVYPFDKKLNVDFSKLKMVESFVFKGSSHEKITCEVWEKE